MKMNQMEPIQSEGLEVSVADHALVLCARAKELEEAGKYDEARVVLSDFWQRIGDSPKLDGLGELARAELVLRVGTLSGWLGSTRQIPGAQEIAKDLLTQSSAMFEKLELTEKVAEAQVDLGICYWREGALDEARISFDTALERLGELECQQRLRALLNKALIEEVSSRSAEALRIFAKAEPLFEVSSNHALKGKFHNEFGTALKNVGLAERREEYIDRSLMQYTAASVELEEAGHKPALAGVENNLGFLFAHLGRFQEAHEHLDRAQAVCARLDNRGFVAHVEDTRGRVFLAEGRLDEAEQVAASAVRRFRGSDEQSSLAAALTTQATALARLGKHTDALTILNEAVSISAQVGDPEKQGLAALTIIEELSSSISPAEVREYYNNAESALKNSEHAAIRFRLGESARTILANDAGTPATEEASSEVLVMTGSLDENVLRYEGELIRKALLAADGSVTRAARMLGVTHQGLAFILNGRQKNLLSSRKPAKPRRRSIIRYH
jgi:tetratricopeptide (TPR) repeat protein